MFDLKPVTLTNIYYEVDVCRSEEGHWIARHKKTGLESGVTHNEVCVLNAFVDLIGRVESARKDLKLIQGNSFVANHVLQILDEALEKVKG